MKKPREKPFKQRARQERRPPMIPTLASLHDAALAYVARYAATEAALRRVLQNRIRKAAYAHPAFAADAAAIAALNTAIEALIDKHRRLGAVNDAAYAGMKAGSLRRAGRSRRFIQQKLAAKGVQADLALAAIEHKDAEQGDVGMGGADGAELAAAVTYAKRKRLGVYRMAKPPADPLLRRKLALRDLAALARNGFAFGIAQQALGGAELGDDDSYARI